MTERTARVMMTTLLTQEEYETLLDELAEYRHKVQLDKDPIAIGLKSFNEKLCDIQTARERVSAILLDAIWNKEQASKIAETARHDFETRTHIALATDTTISTLKSTDLRAAKIAHNNPTELKKLKDANLELSKAEAFHKSVVTVSKDLETKNENLINQINTARLMMNLDPELREEVRIKCRTT